MDPAAALADLRQRIPLSVAAAADPAACGRRSPAVLAAAAAPGLLVFLLARKQSFKETFFLYTHS